MLNLVENILVKNHMKKFVFLTMLFGLMIVATNGVSAQNKGNGRVLTVNGTTEMTPKIGDEIKTYIGTSNGNYGIPKGAKYTTVEWIQPYKITYMYYATDAPDLQDKMNDKRTKISGVCTKSQAVKKNDKFSIQAQPENGGTYVTLTFPESCFSFNVIEENEQKLCSKNGGERMDISWKNNTKMTLRINWVNTRCEEQKNSREIKPGDVYNGVSYEGHWFIIRDFNTNKRLGHREVKEQYANMGIPK